MKTRSLSEFSCLSEYTRLNPTIDLKKDSLDPDEMVPLSQVNSLYNRLTFVVYILLLSCQPRVTVTPCLVYKIIRGLKSIDHLCINTIRRIGLIHM